MHKTKKMRIANAYYNIMHLIQTVTMHKRNKMKMHFMHQMQTVGMHKTHTHCKMHIMQTVGKHYNANIDANNL